MASVEKKRKSIVVKGKNLRIFCPWSNFFYFGKGVLD